MDKQTSSSKPETTPTTTDDESITTSTASDFLESWTLVTGKQKENNETLETDEGNRVEILTKDKDEIKTSKPNAEEEKNNEPTPEHDASYDEFSDEVSIISESDSGEVIKPHPYLQEHLHKLNLKFTTGQGLDLPTLLQQQQLEEQKLQLEREDQQSTPPNTPLQLQRPTTSSGGSISTQVRQRKRRSPSADVAQKSLKPQTAPCTAVQRSYLVRRVYSVFFYTIVGLLILGFFGKLSYPEWPLGGGSSSNSRTVNDLEQKVIDMELQNNLMRAEIDLLSKQVNYLNTLKDKHPERKKPEKYQWNQHSEGYKDKEKNHWQDEPKMENAKCASEELINEERKEAINNFREPVTSSQSKGNKYTDPLNTNEPVATKNEEKPQPIFKDAEKQMESQKENTQFDQKGIRKDKQYKQAEYHRKGYRNDENLFKERFNKHNSKERRNSKEMNSENLHGTENSNENFKRNGRNSKERNEGNRKREDGSNENFKQNFKNGFNKGQRNNRDDDNSKEHFKKNEQRKQLHHGNDDNDSREHPYDSKERYKRNGMNNFKDSSKERKLKKRRNKANSNENFGNHETGEWHENLMHQREKARIEQEQRFKREKNWYLNRHDSRERWRTDEMNRR